MLTPNSPPLPPAERLALIYAGLGDTDRRTLLAFAEFLAAGGRPAPTPAASAELNPVHHRDPHATPIPLPTPLPRPEQETVIAAIRRLTLTYAMLDRAPMLHETAALMSAHVLHGRAAAQVIDDLEALFHSHYQNHRLHLADPTGNRNDND